MMASSISNQENKKRKLSEIVISDSDDDVKVIKIDAEPTVCKYGSDCYRKNPEHLREFTHPPAQNATASDARSQVQFYLTKVYGIQNDKSYTKSISEILSENDHDLLQSAQFNYMFDIIWLMDQYTKANRDKPLLIVHGDQNDVDLRREASVFPQIKLVKARLDMPYGTHHTKMMILVYKSGLKVIVHTSNLIEQDWHQKTQGMWISDLFPKCKSTENMMEFDSKTGFKKDLVSYLESYRDDSIRKLIETVKQHDMTSANVFLIASSPGRYIANKDNFGHLKLKNILSKYCNIDPSAKTKIVSQFSSIGSLGPNENSWLCSEFYNSLNTTTKKPTTSRDKIICVYPTVENVRFSLEGYSAGGSLPYSKDTAKKQPYLNTFLHQWKAETTKRSRASPHIKTYAKYSDDFDKLYWFLLTSSNLSKAAWGCYEKNQTQLMIRSYELGVLFVPSIIKVKTKHQDTLFPTIYPAISKKSDKENEFFKVNQEFLIPYDLPPMKYDVTGLIPLSFSSTIAMKLLFNNKR